MGVKAKGSRFLTVMGWIAICLFVLIYILELFPHHGPPVTIRWIRENLGTAGLIILNVVIVLAFLALLPFRRPTKNVWKYHSAFFAFVIAFSLAREYLFNPAAMKTANNKAVMLNK